MLVLWQKYKEMLILELEEMKKYFLDSASSAE
jgi:hypothetical protein